MEIKICIGENCHLNGSEAVIKAIRKFIKENEISVKINMKGNFCQGKCTKNKVVISIDSKIYKVTDKSVSKLLKDELL